MYKKLTAGSYPTQSSPVDNMRVNGTGVDEVVEGYRQLTVSGRNGVGNVVKSESIPRRRGVWIDYWVEEVRYLEIKYKLEAPSSEELQERFYQLRNVLTSNELLKVTFDDMQGWEYEGVLLDMDPIEENALSFVSTFKLIVPDVVARKEVQSSNGPVQLTYAKSVIPHKITVTPTSQTNEIIISNGRDELTFRGSYASGSPIQIEWTPDEVIAKHQGRSVLTELERFGYIEDFAIQDGDTITATNASVLVEWRDER